MAGCCGRDYERIFGRRFAGTRAVRYRKRGLDRVTRQIVDYLRRQGIAGATVLEIGGGVGEIQIELLKAGAARATNLELSAGYEEDGRRLAAEAGLTERIDRRIHNIAEDAAVEPADVVLLHRVVCCYGDYRGLLGAAADHATRLLVFSHPPRNLFFRGCLAAVNLGMRLTRSSFRSYAHPAAAMAAVLEEHGMRKVHEHRGVVWRVSAFERAASNA